MSRKLNTKINTALLLLAAVASVATSEASGWYAYESRELPVLLTADAPRRQFEIRVTSSSADGSNAYVANQGSIVISGDLGNTGSGELNALVTLGEVSTTAPDGVSQTLSEGAAAAIELPIEWTQAQGCQVPDCAIAARFSIELVEPSAATRLFGDLLIGVDLSGDQPKAGARYPSLAIEVVEAQP